MSRHALAVLAFMQAAMAWAAPAHPFGRRLFLGAAGRAVGIQAVTAG